MTERAHEAISESMQQAIERFLPAADSVESVGRRSHLVRVETPEGSFRVREWPAHATRQRVEFAARLRMTLHEQQSDLNPAPVMTADGGKPLVEIGGRYFDADSWQPGRPSLRRAEMLMPDGHGLLTPNALPGNGIANVAAAIARWHLAAEPLVTAPNPPVAGMRAVLDAVHARWSADRIRLRPMTMSHVWAQRWLKYGEQILIRTEETLSSVGFFEDTPPVVGHLNLWPNHLLFSGPRLTGILDGAQAALTTPLLDIAATMTHFGGWTSENAEIALGAYAEERRLTPDERRMLPLIAAIDLIPEAARLLWFAFGRETDQFGDIAERSRVGAEVLVRSIEALAPAAGRAGIAVSHPKRKWDVRKPSQPVARPVKQRGDTRPDWKKRGEHRPGE